MHHDGTLSIDRYVLTSLIDVEALSGLQIVNNELIVNEFEMSRNLIRLNSNSPITRDDTNFYELKIDRSTIDFDFNSGNLKVKDGYVTNTINEAYVRNYINSTYVKSIINKNYIKDTIVNESWYKDNIYIGEELLRKFSFCWMKLNDMCMTVKNTHSNNITKIPKIANYKDIDYFECFNITFHYRHYTGLLINNIMFDNYIQFNNTNQYEILSQNTNIDRTCSFYV